MAIPFAVGTKVTITIPAVDVIPVSELDNSTMEKLHVGGITIKSASISDGEPAYEFEEIKPTISHKNLRKIK